MTALSSYSTGTVAVTADGTTVTGTSTIWLTAGNVKPGDLFQSGHFCVPITDVADDTHLVITPWPGSTLSGASYVVWKVSQQRIVGETYARDVDKVVGAWNTSGFFVFVGATQTVPDPSLGDDGQYAFQPTTGKTWTKSAGVWSYLGIYKAFQLKGTWSGATAYAVGDVVTLNGSSYACVLDHTNHTPPNATYWQLLASKGDTGPIAWSPPANWVTAHAYIAGPPADVVQNNGSSYACLIAHTSGTFATDLAAGKWQLVAQRGNDGANYAVIPNGRLTLTSGTPVTSSDVTGATTLYYTPYNGDIINLYDGSSWVPIQFSETALSLSGFTPNINIDIWGFINAGALALTFDAWTNDTTRATAITKQNGIDVKSGAPTRRLLGTIRTTGTTGQTEDSKVKRFVSNRYNEIPRAMQVNESAASWNYSTSAFRQANANAANQLDFVLCTPRLVAAEMIFAMSNTTAFGTLVGGIGLDSTTTDSSTTKTQAANPLSSGVYNGKANYAGYVAAGRHTLTWLEYSVPNGGTMTAYGTLTGSIVGGDALRSGLTGMLLA